MHTSELPASLTYGAGNEHDPGNPFGRFVLTVSGTGAAELTHHQRFGEVRTWTGQMDVAQLAATWAALDRGGFPSVPPGPAPPGSTMRVVVADVASDDHPTATVEWHAGGKLEGYREAFAILDAFIRELGGDRIVS
jgi:hypothetical protein